MKKLYVFTLYPELGASSRYRAYIFKEQLEKVFDVKWYSFWNNQYVTKYMFNKRKYALQIVLQYLSSSFKRIVQLCFFATKGDVVFIQKGTVPKSKLTFLKPLKRRGVRIVFDVDDAIYTNIADNSDKIAAISDCVICGNETLLNHYKIYNKNCMILPTVEKTSYYEPFWTDTFDNKIIGWIGSMTTINNFDLIVDALNEVTLQHPEVCVAIISNTALEYTSIINNSYLIPWQQDTYIQELSKFTIGIMPLKDNEGNRGKCGFKLIQYLNMKKPIIGSPVGLNTDIIRGNGIAATTKDEWVKAFETLLFDRSEYDNCVKNIEKDFFENYHFDNVARTLVETINGN